MAKILSFASWNVKNFSNKHIRVDRVVSLLKEKDPDIFALYEVRGSQVFNALMDKMPSHSFSITENTIQNDMEILVGSRRTIQCFVSQREEFRSKVPTLRPGALATLKINNAYYSLLFLHVKSFKEPRDWGLRDDMFKHVASLKRVLDKLVTGNNTSKFICLGDLNTMGLSAAYNDKSDLSADKELEFLDKRMDRVNMRRLSKNHEASWWNGKDHWDPSKLDHVYADNSLNFKESNGFDISTVGWPEKSTKAQKKTWIEKYSDHALIYGEIIS